MVDAEQRQRLLLEDAWRNGAASLKLLTLLVRMVDSLGPDAAGSGVGNSGSGAGAAAGAAGGRVNSSRFAPTLTEAGVVPSPALPSVAQSASGGATPGQGGPGPSAVLDSNLKQAVRDALALMQRAQEEQSHQLGLAMGASPGSAPPGQPGAAEGAQAGRLYQLGMALIVPVVIGFLFR